MMDQRKPWLTRTSVLLASFAAMVLLMSALRQTGEVIGGMLDLQFTGEASRALLAQMTEQQRDLHAHATAFYDSLYPLAYGAFFSGLAIRLRGRQARWIAMVMLAGMVADYAENVVQLLALSGWADVLAVKTLLTPLKFGLTGVAVASTVVIAARAALKYLRASK